MSFLFLGNDEDREEERAPLRTSSSLCVPGGRATYSANPQARCDFFMWVDYKKKLPILIVSCVYKDILQKDLNKKIVLIL